MQLIDSHCHLDDESFQADFATVIQRARDSQVSEIVVPAIARDNWQAVKQVCQDYPSAHPAYGLHPMFMERHTVQHLEELEQWLANEQVVAVGECGLDFFIEDADQAKQQACFEGQLALAQQFDLPVIIHARRSVEQVINTLKRYPGLRGVLHSFSGSRVQADRLIAMGFFMGFGGPISYPRANRLRELVSNLPLESILLETDAPDQPDSSHPGERNEPGYLPIILRTLAQLQKTPAEAIAEVTSANARRLFNLA